MYHFNASVVGVLTSALLISLFSPSQSSFAQPEGGAIVNDTTVRNDTAIQNNLPQSEQLEQWKTYTNDRAGYSVEYPQSWIVSEFADGIVDLKSPTETETFTFIEILAEPGANGTSDDIEAFTDLAIDETLAFGERGDFTRQLASDANMTKYKLDGEPAGTFTYNLVTKPEFYDIPPTAISTTEVVTVIHDGRSYVFQFSAPTDEFNSQVPVDVFNSTKTTEMREHMFNSIRWLN